jgi:hypothetical protein
MNRPSIMTFLIGNPVTLLLVIGTGGWLIYEWWHGLAPPMAALISIALIAWSGTASRELSDYYNWRRAWKAMGPPSPPGLLSRPGVRLVFGVGIVLGLGYTLATHPTPNNQLALGWLVLGVLLLLAFWTVRGVYRRIRRRTQTRARQRTETVSICIIAPAEPVPLLAQAYRQLPEHCYRVLKRRSGS